MEYRIEKNSGHIDIAVSTISSEQQQLIDAFKACQSGRCTCPTDEYKKLDSFELDSSDGSISLKLTPRQGQQLDENEIRHCLEHTQGKLRTTVEE